MTLPLPFGSSTFKRLWKQVAQNLDRYRTFPRLAGGKPRPSQADWDLALIPPSWAIMREQEMEWGGQDLLGMLGTNIGDSSISLCSGLLRSHV